VSAPHTAPVPGPAAAGFLGAPRRMLIGADWCDALSGRRLEVRDPATAEVVTTVPAAGPEDVDRAVKAARTAFESREWGAASVEAGAGSGEWGAGAARRT